MPFNFWLLSFQVFGVSSLKGIYVPLSCNLFQSPFQWPLYVGLSEWNSLPVDWLLGIVHHLFFLLGLPTASFDIALFLLFCIVIRIQQPFKQSICFNFWFHFWTVLVSSKSIILYVKCFFFPPLCLYLHSVSSATVASISECSNLQFFTGKLVLLESLCHLWMSTPHYSFPFRNHV